MTSQPRLQLLHKLDQTLAILKPLRFVRRPEDGWIKCLREALGMSSAQLGDRTGLAVDSVKRTEQAEADGQVTVAELDQIAKGLGCTFVYGFIPDQSLKGMMQQRVRSLAETRVKHVSKIMYSEVEPLSPDEVEWQIKGLMKELFRQPPSTLWEQPRATIYSFQDGVPRQSGKD